MMTPFKIAELLRRDFNAVEKIKRDVSIPIENIPHPFAYHRKLLDHAFVPDHCHGRNHIPLLGTESARVVMDILEGVFSSTEEIGTEAFDEKLSRYVGRTVLRSKKVEFAGKTIAQIQIHLRHAVFSQRVRLPMRLAETAVLHRRHVAPGAAPGVDFFVRLNDDIRQELVFVNSLIATVCIKGKPSDIGLGTVYAGTTFPGESIDNDGGGILYKWYPDDETRAEDARRFSDTVSSAMHMDVLLNPEDYQNLIR